MQDDDARQPDDVIARTMPARPRHRPTSHAPDELTLPPLDGDDDDAPSPPDGEVGELGDFESPLDDATADDADLAEPWNPDEGGGWLDDGSVDAASDGDDAEDIDAGDDESWLAEEGDASAAESDDELREESSERGADAGEEGPDDEPQALEEAGPLDGDEEGEGADDQGPLEQAASDLASSTPAPAGFALPAPTPLHACRIDVDGAVMAAAVGDDECVLVGEGAWTLRLSALTAAITAERVVAPKRGAVAIAGDEVLTTVVAAGPRRYVAAGVDGRVLGSEDGGQRWEPATGLGTRDGGVAAVELFAGPRTGGGAAWRVWARAHGGVLFRSDDHGGHWEGPAAAGAVRAIAVDPRGGVTLAVTAGRTCDLLRSTDGTAWTPARAPLAAAPTLLATRGDVVAIAFRHGPGLVSPDGGATVVSCDLLDGATAVAIVETNDGETQLLAAVYHEATDRSTLIAARVGPDGAVRGARRIADVDELLRERGEPAEDAPDSHIEAVVPLDSAGRRILLITPRGVVALARDGA